MVVFYCHQVEIYSMNKIEELFSLIRIVFQQNPSLRVLVHICSVVFLILIIYSNTIHAPFQWDDDEFIVNNPFIRNLDYSVNDSGSKELRILQGDLTNRYIGYVTFAMNYRAHGLSVTGYHIVNIAIHVANAILIYILVLITFKTPFLHASPLRRQSPSIALFSSLIFAAHPIQTEAVTYIFQRLASLMTLFYLLSLTAYIQSRTGQNRLSKILYYGIALFSAALAMKTKENAFTLPIMIAVFDFCFFNDSWKKRALFLAPILLTLAIIPLTLLGLFGSTLHSPSYMSEVPFDRSSYLFTQFRVIVTYLRLLVFPINQNLWYDYPTYSSFVHPQVLLSFVFLTSLFLFGVSMTLQTRSDGAAASGLAKSSAHRLIGFGILWFFIAISVESSVIPLYQLIDEYRVYLPSAGLIISFVTGIFLLKEQFKVSRVAVLTSFVIAVMVLSAATYARNEVWNDKISLWEDIVSKSPRKERAHFGLGTAYVERNMLDKALEQFSAALALDPYDAQAHNGIGTVYLSKGMFDKAVEHFQLSISILPNYPYSHYNLALTYQAKKMYDRAIEEYLTVLRLRPYDADAHNNLAHIYQERRMFDKAIAEYQFVLYLNPQYPQGHYYLGLTYYQAGRTSDAFRELTQELRINPNNNEARQLVQRLSPN